MANTAISALPAATSVASGDVVPVVQGGTTKKVDVSLLGGSGSSSDALGYAATTLTPTTTNNVATAGRIYFGRVTRGTKTGATKIGVQVGAASGNIMVGVYSPSGTGTAARPGTLKGSSVVTACPAAGYAEVTLQAATDIAAGDYLALWCDNVTATFAYIGASSATNRSVSCYFDLGTAATALPATADATTLMIGFSRLYALTGV